MKQTNRPMALVTGASSGIGREFARQLADRGYDLVLTGRRQERLSELSEELTTQFGIKVLDVVADLSLPNGAQQLTEHLLAKDLRLQVLVNNAGLGKFGSFGEQPFEAFQEMIQVNVQALTYLSWAFVRELRAEGECYLLNMGSFSAFNPPSDYAVYAATKSYVLGLTQALAGPGRNSGIKVSALCPGFFQSEFFETAGHQPGVATRALTMNAEAVAKAGLKGLFRGKRMIVPGLIYRTSLFLSRFTPRSSSTPLADLIVRH